jgi:2-C-methyl-D-erythritol 2,4-cyclodiphosphate synthase
MSSLLTADNSRLTSLNPDRFSVFSRLKKPDMSFRLGFGVDFHQLVAGRDLWLGGIKIPHEKGAKGHSDADVLLHAICDSILGAACLGDIGIHFPDTSQEFKDIDSKILLDRSVKLIQLEGYKINNIDCTLCLEQPKIKNHISEMQQVIAGICGININEISIKATTAEKMGFVGREEGVVAYATVLLIK